MWNKRQRETNNTTNIKCDGYRVTSSCGFINNKLRDFWRSIQMQSLLLWNSKREYHTQRAEFGGGKEKRMKWKHLNNTFTLHTYIAHTARTHTHTVSPNNRKIFVLNSDNWFGIYQVFPSFFFSASFVCFSNLKNLFSSFCVMALNFPS